MPGAARIPGPERCSSAAICVHLCPVRVGAVAQAALLGLLAVVLYLPTLGHGFVNWDDDRLLLDLRCLEEPASLLEQLPTLRERLA